MSKLRDKVSEDPGSAAKNVPQKVVLGAGDLEGFHDVAHAVRSPDELAVLKDPVQLVLLRGGLTERACGCKCMRDHTHGKGA